MSEVIPLRGETALRDVLQQSMRSGMQRRAVVLHTDRLPPVLARPHHVRLAREALRHLDLADRAQSFELPRGRFAVVWRGRADAELAKARATLDHLLAGQPDAVRLGTGELLTVYDLPSQAAWLMGEIAQADSLAPPPASLKPLDAKGLACLEARLAQSDLSRFTRWSPVMRLGQTGCSLAWEERFFSIGEISAALCPEHDAKGDPWLFRRLTRMLDRRMLAMLASPRELRGCGTFALHLNTETILSAAFVSFDEALPVGLRGEVVLNLSAADILADPDGFTFARRFAQARDYRLALSNGSAGLLRFLDLRLAGLDYVHLSCSAELMKAPGAVTSLIPAATTVVLSGLDRPGLVDWAVEQGFQFGSGRALSL